MYRMLFEKKANSVWISHLDLMRVFQRAFMRAGLSLTHTQGFNPRPSVSIALPLSVGAESCCELLDFDLENDNVSCDYIREALNKALIEGVRVLDVYSNGKKLKELAYLRCAIVLEYDKLISADARTQICELFHREEVMVPKKTKNNGIQDQNIIPMIKEFRVCDVQDGKIRLEALVCCQNPSLNPMQIVSAVELHIPQLKPDYSSFQRLEIYDQNMNVFR